MEAVWGDSVGRCLGFGTDMYDCVSSTALAAVSCRRRSVQKRRIVRTHRPASPPRLPPSIGPRERADTESGRFGAEDDDCDGMADDVNDGDVDKGKGEIELPLGADTVTNI